MTTTTPVKARRRWLTIGSLLLGFVAGYLLTSPAESSHSQFSASDGVDGLNATDSIPAEPADLLAPSATFSPKQVVEVQMHALADYRNHRAAIHQVFAHASPTNRAVTGPLQRFEQMIMHPQYRDLTVSKHFMVGQAVQHGNDATVLVTTVDEQGNMSVYRFILSKQMKTYPGCWMTDGVFLLVGDWRPGKALPGVEQNLLNNI